jgi:SAM-dependent methyltransferase
MMSAMTTREEAAFKAFEAAGWGARAETYERVTGRLTARAIEPLLDAGGVGPGLRVLDVGTGNGAIAAAAAARGASPVGVDLASEMVARARALHRGLEFGVGDAEELPFDDGAFDLVVAGFVFNHVPRPDAAAAECFRVTARGGRLALSVWDEPRNAPFFGVIAEAMAMAGIDAAEALPPGPDPYRFADEDELRGLLGRAGFGEATVRTVEISVRVADASELFAGIVGGTVRTATALEHASEGQRARVATALAEVVAAYRSGDGIELPARVKVAAGRRAG